MGFLDHSTNNIIIDAVLTDKGRELLSNNEGNFKIAFFSLSDDEVDYNIIEKFGRAVGKEKISKNTPIFEAQTIGSLAMKHRLLTLPNPKVVRLPSYTLNGINFNDENSLLDFRRDVSSNEMTINQNIAGGAPVPEGVADTTFTIQVPDRFLTVEGRSRISLEPTTRTATYGLTAGRTQAQGATATFSLRKQSIDDTTFTIYGSTGNKDVIRGVVSIIGDQSGLRADFEFQITK